LIYLFIEKFMLKILTRLQVTPGLNADFGQKSEQSTLPLLDCSLVFHWNEPWTHQDPRKWTMDMKRHFDSCLMDWCVCAGLACRTLDPTKILVVGKSRLLINCSGILFGCLMDWCVCVQGWRVEPWTPPRSWLWASPGCSATAAES